VEKASGLSSEEDEDEEDHLGSIEEGTDGDDGEEDADASRISQWVDEDSYEYVNDEPVRPHSNSYEYI